MDSIYEILSATEHGSICPTLSNNAKGHALEFVSIKGEDILIYKRKQDVIPGSQCKIYIKPDIFDDNDPVANLSNPQYGISGRLQGSLGYPKTMST